VPFLAAGLVVKNRATAQSCALRLKPTRIGASLLHVSEMVNAAQSSVQGARYPAHLQSLVGR